MLTKNFTNLKPMAEIGLRAKLLIGVFTALSLSCASSQDSSVDLAEPVLEDGTYYDVYVKNTDSYKVMKDFQTKFHINVTILSGELRQAIASRYQKIYSENQSILGEATDKTGFFISLYVADEEQEDLRDQRLWNVFLETDEAKLPPILIKKLYKKARWETFFPAVNLWTHEYLILFDLPSPSSREPLLLKEKSRKFVVANGDGKVSIEF